MERGTDRGDLSEEGAHDKGTNSQRWGLSERVGRGGITLRRGSSVRGVMNKGISLKEGAQ